MRKIIIPALVVSILVLAGIAVVISTRLVEDQAPDDSSADSPVGRNDGKCTIGWANSNVLVTAEGAGGYMGYNIINSAKPAGSTIKVFDLNGGNPPGGNFNVTDENLADVDILFISDGGDNYVRTNNRTPSSTQLNVIASQFNSGMHILTASDNAGWDAEDVEYAAAMGRPVTNRLAIGIDFRDINRSTFALANNFGTTNSSTYSFLSGLPYDTRTMGLRSPSQVVTNSPSSCIQSISDNLNVSTCLLSYYPKSASSGFYILDGNGGLPTRALVSSGRLWEQIPDCAPKACGNGIVESGEQCDDGNTNNSDTCTNLCIAQILPVCGNGTIEGTEECDDGNLANGDGCDSSCKTTTECSDGIDNDNDGRIDCQNGNEDPGCFPDGRGGGGSCNPDDDDERDAPATCGDGNLDPGEECDNGTANGNGRACSTSCRPNPECNDGLDNDNDGRIDCGINGSQPDLGCFPDGRGGGGSCNVNDPSELNSADPAPINNQSNTLPQTGIFDDGILLFLGLLWITLGYLWYKTKIGNAQMEKLILWFTANKDKPIQAIKPFEERAQSKLEKKIRNT